MLEIQIQIPEDVKFRALQMLGHRDSGISELITIPGAKITLKGGDLSAEWSAEGISALYELLGSNEVLSPSGQIRTQSALRDP